MRLSGPKAVLAGGLTFVLLCVAAGFLMESDADRDQILAGNMLHGRLQNAPLVTPADAHSFALELSRLAPELSPDGLKYEGGSAVLLMAQPRMRWQKL
jgi:hypothetical protein